eukprot:438068-Pelagomonas_calceolata.AAC.4
MLEMAAWHVPPHPEPPCPSGGSRPRRPLVAQPHANQPTAATFSNSQIEWSLPGASRVSGKSHLSRPSGAQPHADLIEQLLRHLAFHPVGGLARRAKLPVAPKIPLHVGRCCPHPAK